MPRANRNKTIAGGTTPMTGAPFGAAGGTGKFRKPSSNKVRARTGHLTDPNWSGRAANVSPQIQQGLANMINGLTTLNVDLSKITPDQLYQYGLTCFGNV